MSGHSFFADPHPDHARDAFRDKPRALTNKVTTVADAVKRLVVDGDYLAIGGFGTNRIPTAVCHEIVRQKKQNLRFAGHTATHDFQLLCAGNLTDRGQTLAKVDAAYVVGLEARGLSPQARRVLESGTVEVSEWSNYALAVRFRAAAMGVPYLPVRSMMGTDTGKYSGAKEILCPYTGVKLLALPAIYPDVAAIHVHEADVYGNARIRGTNVADNDVARAAKKLIITCERLVPHEEFRREPDRTSIPYYCVDAVCEVPFGSYPGNMPYEYFSDEDHLKLWLKQEEDPVQYRQFLNEALWSHPDFDAYLNWAGGLKRMQALRQQEFLI
ncbi:MAG: CoA-transferase [Gemmatales bacterium]